MSGSTKAERNRLMVAKMIRSEPDTLENTEDLLYGMTEMPGFITGYIRPDIMHPQFYVLTSLFNTWSGNGSDPKVPGVTDVTYAFGTNPEGVVKRKFQMWTIQMSKWRLAQKHGVVFVDSTVKSGAKFLAPTWEIVWGVKKGKITEAEYTEQYLAMMKDSVIRNEKKWLELINNRAVAIACYCTPGHFCHRRLLIDILKELCVKHGIEFEYMGEMLE